MEIGFTFYQSEIIAENAKTVNSDENLIDLETGKMTAEQIKVLFNHPRVEITFVDENDKVVYFSALKNACSRVQNQYLAVTYIIFIRLKVCMLWNKF